MCTVQPWATRYQRHRNWIDGNQARQHPNWIRLEQGLCWSTGGRMTAIDVVDDGDRSQGQRGYVQYPICVHLSWWTVEYLTTTIKASSWSNSTEGETRLLWLWWLWLDLGWVGKGRYYASFRTTSIKEASKPLWKSFSKYERIEAWIQFTP